MAKPPEKSLKAVTPAEPDEFTQELVKRIGAVVSSPGQRAQVIAQVVGLVTEERFSGPIAHPRHLREYEEILPGSADRIIGMAESNLAHNQAMQAKALDGDIQDTHHGRLYGFLALCLLIIGAIVSAYMGSIALAVAFLSAGALGTVGAFIKGKRGQPDA